MEVKKCSICEVEKPITEFKRISSKDKSKVYRYSFCRDCQKRKRNNYYYEIKEFWDVPNEPNTYSSEEERKMVFQMMESMGWLFNPKNGIWYKDGIKDSNGNWLKIKKSKPSYSIEMLNHLVQLKSEGFTFKYLCEMYGMNYQKVIKLIRFYKL